MLNNLKSTPSPLNELVKKERKGKKGKNKDQTVSNLGWPPMGTDIQSSALRAHQTIQELLHDKKANGKVAQKRREKLLREGDPLQFVPFSMLSDYRTLGEATQLQLLKQLIERFQRTSCTPRYAMLPTPRVDGINDTDLFGIDILGSPKGLGIMNTFGDSNVFEIPDDDLLTSNTSMGLSGTPMGITNNWHNLSDSLPSPLSVKFHTVVSSVLGNAFVNSVAMSGSRNRAEMSRIAASTATDSKRRCSGGMRATQQLDNTRSRQAA
jgi:hypothetical protein